jgi:hypothetical protein
MQCKPSTKIKIISHIDQSLLRKFLVMWLVEAQQEMIVKIL